MNKHLIFLSATLCVLLLKCNPSVAQEAQAALIKNNVDELIYTVPTDLNEDEKYWFVKFQEGNLFADGWQEITKSILAKTPVKERNKQKALLARLGEKIGLEWCKDNDSRKIDTSMLQSWGKQLKNTAKKDPDRLGMLIASIDREVDTILD